MLFSTATAYALQALAALSEDGSYSQAKDLSEELHLPGPYLAKILQTLAQNGILESLRGPKGGFRMARPAHRITVGDVVDAMEGPEVFSGCVMGFPECSGDNPCPLHDAWSQVKAHMDSSMTQSTIRDLQLVRLRHESAREARKG